MSMARRAYALAIGKAKRMAAVLSGRPGLLSKLEGEHREIAVLLERIHRTFYDGDLETRSALFARVRRELLVHEMAEERELYALLRSFRRLRPWIEKGEMSHAEIRQILGELERRRLDDPSWRTLFGQLQSLFENHAQDEQTELFARTRELLSPERLRRMGDSYHRHRQIVAGELEHRAARRPPRPVTEFP